MFSSSDYHTWRFASPPANLSVNLPVGVYNLGKDIFGWVFNKIENFSLPPKFYGATIIPHSERMMNTFLERDKKNTAILLSGEKGSGKTLLAKKLCVDAVNRGISVMVIDQPYDGPTLSALLTQLGGRFVFLFDEFEKVYEDTATQNSLLSVLDGTTDGSHMFIMTANEDHKLSPYMINRPGRIYYAVKFRGLEADFIRDYCNDTLVNKNHTDSVLEFSEIFTEFNFDMLQSVVEEMNRYNEDAKTASKLLNARVDLSSGGNLYKVYMMNAKDEIIGTTEVNLGSPTPVTYSTIVLAEGHHDADKIFSLKNIDELIDAVTINTIGNIIIGSDVLLPKKNVYGEKSWVINPEIKDKNTKFCALHFDESNYVGMDEGKSMFKNNGYTLAVKRMPKKDFSRGRYWG